MNEQPSTDRLPARPIIVCADDYGIAPGVSEAIAGLIAAGRLSATSCMTPLPDWKRRAGLLRKTVATHPADVGLHLTLTDHVPLSAATGFAQAGRLPSMGRLLPRALARALPRQAIRTELCAQLDAFEDAWNAPPDYIDGHQHAHVLPGIREVVVEELLRRYPAGSVWVRDCCEPLTRCLQRRTALPKALLISTLGVGLHRLLRRRGLPANSGFAGLHDFSGRIPFRTLMQSFLAGSGPRPLVHVHPGRVDDELRACDTLTTPRETELAYLASPAFAEDLAAAGLHPARFAAFARPAPAISQTSPPDASSGSIR
ncbi:ChbG/HpnK family deacetylase [Aromatoleum evansii]|uniref:ChbG/HpnK family deacetylase n=1 Tax=Aromatoleum evansii TaxID=59406 RepID=A0ABZ1AMI2_AROEV|nr:ChbG/HpnK family deacetylase [Aromatoleum evansii]NMG31645.1 ChbG/HpnK family deacetylase [Aromatoleum evansii]WRL47072.1 ChbG/HpnK family deacetylase [Aromatoleum evansii]